MIDNDEMSDERISDGVSLKSSVVEVIENANITSQMLFPALVSRLLLRQMQTLTPTSLQANIKRETESN